MCQCIAMGLLQLIALRYSGRVPAYLRQSIFLLFAQNPHLSITKIIRSKQETFDFDAKSLVLKYENFSLTSI
ncbi:hypothetical protein M0651_18930 [Paenibacillus sp. MBLB2552]|uniref:Uncharacterized protein n=1 Tax=Paenibacillus mellifer TaxID=2937794 RepID=A0A9X1Y3Z7_9BACL|nr:hypothetical protein [Paenibacillus mellifer]MCK8489251.1 hypothetical protein [Paenibacillus mellifer]